MDRDWIDDYWATFPYDDAVYGPSFGIRVFAHETGEVIFEEIGFVSAYDANACMSDFITEARVLFDNGMTSLNDILSRENLN